MEKRKENKDTDIKFCKGFDEKAYAFKQCRAEPKFDHHQPQNTISVNSCFGESITLLVS